MCVFFGVPSPPPLPEPPWLSEAERQRRADHQRAKERLKELEELYAKRDKIIAKRNFWLRLATRINTLTALILEALRGKRV